LHTHPAAGNFDEKPEESEFFVHLHALHYGNRGLCFDHRCLSELGRFGDIVRESPNKLLHGGFNRILQKIEHFPFPSTLIVNKRILHQQNAINYLLSIIANI
jgi:hypothetical protein